MFVAQTVGADHPSGLVQAITALSSARRMRDAMRVAARHARSLIGADGVSVVLRDGDKCYYAEEDAISPLWKGRRFPMSACISGWVMRERTHVVIEDIRGDPRIPQDLYDPTFVRSLLMVPMGTEPPTGAMEAYWSQRRAATDTELQTLRTIAQAMGVLIGKGTLDR